MTNVSNKNIAVLISGGGSNLQSIIDACESENIDGNIVAVISNKPDAFGLERAKKHDIQALTIDHTKFNSRLEFDRALIDAIDQLNVDLLVLAGFMRILTPEFTSHYKGKLLNIHPSLLPLYPGLNTHQRAIESGDKTAGASIHFVTAELDGGPIILQAQVNVEGQETAETLAAKVIIQEHIIYPEAIKWFCDGRLCLNNNSAYLDGNPLTLPITQ